MYATIAKILSSITQVSLFLITTLHIINNINPFIKNLSEQWLFAEIILKSKMKYLY